ncbi:hypothetical protein CONLIGDRAFT_672242 [Coniochaeta ligniaria NRRL 30616]|uniref:Uncharacterized protein n=1 Tax=Coniochaeta ligniaria NRRL 30616 TaxID=1408157 RepID=A0A1J7JGK6_9PEZI|nr:hypothetical protein CONLIGDRAFT_672242 [Coniochaeta ligniaria NRRL 30616]
MEESSGRATRPHGPTQCPRHLRSDIAPKYEKRGFTSKLAIIRDDHGMFQAVCPSYDLSLDVSSNLRIVVYERRPALTRRKKEKEEDDEELEYPDNTPPILGVPNEFLTPSPPAEVRYTFLDSTSSLSAEIDSSAEVLPKTTRDTKAIDNNGNTMPASTASKLALSLRRLLNMRTMREKLGKTAALGCLLRLPGRHGKDTEELKPAAGARGEVSGKHSEGSLARRLFGREKKPKRPKVPEGWLFGLPPE